MEKIKTTLILAKVGEKYAVYFPAGRYAVEPDLWFCKRAKDKMA